MRFVEVDPVAEYLVYGGGALAGFVLKWGIQKAYFPLSLDYVHALPMAIAVGGLTFCAIRKMAKRGTVPLWIWLPVVGSVGWGSGIWVASRFG